MLCCAVLCCAVLCCAVLCLTETKSEYFFFCCFTFSSVLSPRLLFPAAVLLKQPLIPLLDTPSWLSAALQSSRKPKLTFLLLCYLCCAVLCCAVLGQQSSLCPLVCFHSRAGGGISKAAKNRQQKRGGGKKQIRGGKGKAAEKEKVKRKDPLAFLTSPTL